MVNQTSSRVPGQRIVMPIKATDQLRHRLKVAAAEEGLSYAQLLWRFLDQRDAAIIRTRRAQAHPFHRPDLDQMEVG